MASRESKYFLPYQVRWLKDLSPVKIWEKSRRIGATYVQSYEDVRDCVKGSIPAVWFSSADESAAKEYIIYAAQWAKLFDAGARDLGQIVLDSDKNIKTFTVEFSNGKRINALSSSPKAFRSKGGKVILDEFAHHEDAPALWKAAKPSITWGFPLRILSTHNGQQALFFKFVESVKKGKLKWSMHTTDIFKAVEEGLADKILKRVLTDQEKEDWIQQQKEDCFDDFTWLEEFCCIAVDEASAFLDYNLISTCEEYNIEWPDDVLASFKNYPVSGDLFVGVDIGRRKDLTVIWICEKLGSVNYTRKVVTLEKTPFKTQQNILFNILHHPGVRRACIDATGLGMQLAETAQDVFGKYKLEAVTFTGPVKEEMAYNLRTNFEDRNIRIPVDTDIREDLHSVKKVVTAAKNIRFDVEKSDVKGHADRFWAAALCLFAAKGNSGSVTIVSGRKRMAVELVRDMV